MSSGVSRFQSLMFHHASDGISRPDWIAHGLMDSIVDSFFPVLEEIEKEMDNLDVAMFAERFASTPQSQPDVPPKPVERSSESDMSITPSTSVESGKEKELSPKLSEKIEHPSILQTRFAIPKRPKITRGGIKDFYRSWRSFVSRNVRVKTVTHSGGMHSTVRRVARVRRLVTSLSRILASKSEVVAQVKKRLLMTGGSGLHNNSANEVHEVFVYMGDVQGERNGSLVKNWHGP